MGLIKEFKEFAATGNLVDLAAGVVMGGAIAKVVGAFVDGMVMPAVGMLTGGTDFKDLVVTLKDATKDAAGKDIAAVTVKWGAFISQCIEFLAVALVIFFVLKGYNKLKKKKAEEPAAPAPPAEDVVLLREIRDALRK